MGFVAAVLLASNIALARPECETNLNVSVHFGAMTITRGGYELSNATVEVPFAKPSSSDTCPSAYLIDFIKPPFAGVGAVDALGNESSACAATNGGMNVSDVKDGWAVSVRGERATYYRTIPLSLHEIMKCADSSGKKGSYAWTLYACQATVFSKSLGLYTLACKETPVEVKTEKILSSTSSYSKSRSYSKSMDLEEETSSHSRGSILCALLYTVLLIVIV